MKNLVLSLLLIGLALSTGSTRKGDFFQVISSHPHELDELEPYVETTYKNGRLWIVKLNKDAPLHIMEHLRPLSGGEKSYIHQGLNLGPTKFKRKDPISSYLLKVDKEAIRKDIVELANYETRFTGTPENQLAVQETGKRFAELGYEIKEICYTNDACNLVAERKGKISDEVVLVMGHIDSVGESYAGADDNGSGVAVMLEMARVLKDYSNRKTIRFLVTNGEEPGSLGSAYYVKKLTIEKQIQKISLAINMDMVGFNENGIVELETNPEFDDLAHWYANLAAKYTTLKTKITLGAWGSDHVSFLQKGVPSVLTVEDWDTKNPCYHQECDKPELVNIDYAAEIAKLNLSAVLSKDLF